MRSCGLGYWIAKMRIAGALMLLLVAVGVIMVCGEPAVANYSKQAVKEEYVEWLRRWAARDAISININATQEINGHGFVNEAASSSTLTIVVDREGRGDVSTVQQAVDLVPQKNENRVIIQINSGTYREKIEVPKDKPYITFWAPSGASNTILIWDDTASSAGSTYKSASTAIRSIGFIARGITFQNSAEVPEGGEEGKQAVALMIEGDMAQFYNCSFIGGQDTLYDKEGRHFFKDCYIRGNIDFICGDGQSYYMNCYLDVIADPNSGSLTAQKRSSANDDSGFAFVRCTVAGQGPVYLGRAWGPYSRVVFIYTWFSDIILPEGWYDWGESSRQKTVFYGQYECYGPGSNTSGRVDWAMELTYQQAEPFMTTSFVDGDEWLSEN